MNQKTVMQVFRRLAEIVLSAALYYLTARLGFLITQPPDYAIVLWPPSGIALAAILVLGWHASIGVFAAAAYVMWGTQNGPAALPLTAVIAAASTLQAGITAWLIRRLIPRLPPETPQTTLITIGITFLAALLTPIVSITSLRIAGYISWSSYLPLFITRWLGDFIGVLIFTPPLVVGAKFYWRKHKVKEPLLWLLSSAIIGLALFTFLIVRNAAQQQIAASLRRDADEMTHVLRNTIQHDIQALTAIQALYAASQEVESEEFSAFTAPLLTTSPAILSLSFAPYIQPAERPAFEQSIQAQGKTSLPIYEKDASGNKLPAAERGEYFPIIFSESLTANQAIIGFDLASSPERLEAIHQARDSGEPAGTALIQLIQESEKVNGFFVAMPVYRNGASTLTVIDRRSSLLGIAIGSFRMDALLDKAFETINRRDVELYLYDTEHPAAPQFLAFYPSLSGAQSLPASGAPDPETLQTAIYYTADFNVGHRDWSVIARPGPAYASQSNPWLAWVSLLAGLIIAGTFLAFVNDRQKTEAILARSSEEIQMLSRIASQMADSVVVTDRDGNIEFVNPAFEQLTGYTRAEAIGQTPRILKSGVESPELYKQLWDTILRGEVFQAEIINRKKNGELYYESKTITPIRDAEGVNTHFVATGKDITERKLAQRELEALNRDLEKRVEARTVEVRESRDKLSIANAALEKASRMKDEFLASMSHELRTPLAGILGLAEALQLQAYGELNEKQAKAVKNIEICGRHLLDLINDILDLSKIEAGKLDLQFTSCAVAEICQASLQLMKGMAHQKRQTISFSMNPISITLYADARRLKQMLVNLLSNAVKFTPEGGSLGLEVHGNLVENTVLLSVWDKGIGIKPEDMEQLFKPFVQLDNSLARQYSGTGLGLSLVQRMAELHGGSIQVKSAPGEGSCFTIILPWSEEMRQPEPILPEADASALKSTIVIEDNLLDAEHITRYLVDIGIANVIQPVLSGAFEKVAALRPSVILLDLLMPDGSGLDFLVRLKADPRTSRIPVIITSVEERRAEAAKLGAAGYLVKPFGQRELHAELSRIAAFAHPADPVMVIAARTTAPLVLIADDNEMILTTISDFLRSQDYQVAAARSGFELLERAAELHPDIMLVDIQMPGMDGFETIRRLRAHSDPHIASTPIIAVTALAMAGDREKCLQAGANEYLSKPVQLIQLAAQISQFLKHTTSAD